jgi:hypothetical protein
MEKIDRLGWAAGLSFTSYGMRIGIRVNDASILDQVREYLPPGWKPAASPVVKYLYSLRLGTGRSLRPGIRQYNLLYSGVSRIARSEELQPVLDRLESDLQLLVAAWCQRRVFVHAGVVGWRGKALLLPGRSFAGKTTLVSELLRAGATYYSDEYAVLDAQGRVHPYARPLSLRNAEGKHDQRCGPEALGGRAGVKPLPVGLVALSEYHEGSRWRPRLLSPGQAALALLANTVPARTQPEAALTAIQQVVSRAPVLKGRRGEASETAARMLQTLERDAA